MKTIIIFCTNHGCVEKAAGQIAEILGPETTLHHLKSKKQANLHNYDRVIIGGSIHIGQIQKKLKEFYTKNMEILLEKELGIFICCMEEGEKAKKEMHDVFPKQLLNHAKATACLGGEFNFEKMNFLEKMMVKKVAKVDHTVSRLDHEAIRNFSQQMNKRYQPFFFII